MKTQIFRSIAVALLALFFAQSSFATCGGGGGGGGGGMANSGGGGGASNAPVYIVPWKPPSTPPAGGLVLYWFPASQKEIDNSSLKQSRLLYGYASQCVSMQAAKAEQLANADKLIGESKLPVAVLAKADGTPINKVENTNGKLKVADVEKLVEGEMKQRESSLDGQMKDAAGKVKTGDKDGAIAIYKAVLDQKCLFQKKAKEAAKQLKNLGVADIASVPSSPIFERRQRALIEQTMKPGLIAEMNAHYVLANKLYQQAHLMDPADPTPLRFLGENYRHNIGDWNKAREMFEAILNMPADPLSRSVALHGLGKMTIHDG